MYTFLDVCYIEGEFVKTVSLGVEGEKQQPWKVKSEHKSYNYLTDINEMLTIRI